MSTIRKINVSEIEGRNPFDQGISDVVMPAGTVVVYENNDEYVLRVHNGVTNGGVDLVKPFDRLENGEAVVSLLSNGDLQLPNGGIIAETEITDNPAIVIVPDAESAAPSQALYIKGGAGPIDYHLHLTTGDLTDTSVILGTDEHNVRTTTDGGVEINSRNYGDNVTHTLTFNISGELEFPQGSKLEEQAEEVLSAETSGAIATNTQGNTPALVGTNAVFYIATAVLDQDWVVSRGYVRFADATEYKISGYNTDAYGEFGGFIALYENLTKTSEQTWPLEIFAPEEVITQSFEISSIFESWNFNADGILTLPGGGQLGRDPGDLDNATRLTGGVEDPVALQVVGQGGIPMTQVLLEDNQIVLSINSATSADQREWVFGADGSLTLPTGVTNNGRIINDNGISLKVASSFWTFGTDGSLNVPGHIIPNQNVAHDLGSSSNRFRDLYLSGNTINLGDATISAIGSALELPVGTTTGGVSIGTIIILGSVADFTALTAISTATLAVGDSYVVASPAPAHLWTYNGQEFIDLGVFQGPKGELGYTGSIGFSGSRGNVGFTGSKGDAGTSVTIVGSVATAGDFPNPYTGNIGDGYIVQATGNLWVWDDTNWNDVGSVKGPQGDQGFTGSFGFTGSAGADGAIGLTGSTGASGFTGSAGADGAIGLTGSFGFTGSKGEQGPAGEGSGDVSSINGGYVNNAVIRYDGTSGTNIQNSLVTIADDGAIVAPAAGSIIPFLWANQAAFPSAANNHGAIAHSHADGRMYFAHGTWIPLANLTDVTEGPVGFTGSTGASGENGATGFTGSAGSSGAMGFTGSSGAMGFTGSTGASGFTGSTGPAGMGFTGSTGATGPAGAAASISWSISSSGLADYIFSGPGIVAGNTNDPVLYLYRGFTYTFVNTTGSSHPFAIRVSNGGANYTPGVSGSQTGTQTFVVPMNAPATLYYQCTLHGGMGNVINIV